MNWNDLTLYAVEALARDAGFALRRPFVESSGVIYYLRSVEGPTPLLGLPIGKSEVEENIRGRAWIQLPKQPIEENHIVFLAAREFMNSLPEVARIEVHDIDGTHGIYWAYKPVTTLDNWRSSAFLSTVDATKDALARILNRRRDPMGDTSLTLQLETLRYLSGSSASDLWQTLLLWGAAAKETRLKFNSISELVRLHISDRVSEFSDQLDILVQQLKAKSPIFGSRLRKSVYPAANLST